MQIPDDAPAETQPAGLVIPPAPVETIGPAKQSVVADKEDHWPLAASSPPLKRLTDPVVVASLSLPAVALDAIPHAKIAGGAKLAASPFPPRQVPASPNETAIPATVGNPAIVANTMPTKPLSVNPLESGETGSLLPATPTHRPKITGGNPPVAPFSSPAESFEQAVQVLPTSFPKSQPIAESEHAVAELGIPSPTVKKGDRPFAFRGPVPFFNPVVRQNGEDPAQVPAQDTVLSNRIHAVYSNSDRINAVTTNVVPIAAGMSLPVAGPEKPTRGIPVIHTFSSLPTTPIAALTSVSPPTLDRTASLSPPGQQENGVAPAKTGQGLDVAHKALPPLPLPIVVTAVRSDHIHAVPSPNDPINRVTTNPLQPVPKRDLLVAVGTRRPSVGPSDTVGDRVTTSAATSDLVRNDVNDLGTIVSPVVRPETPPISPQKKGAVGSLQPGPPRDQSKNTGDKPPVEPFAGQVKDLQQAPMAIHTVIGAAPPTSEGPSGIPHQAQQSRATDPSTNGLSLPNLAAATLEEPVQGTQKPAASLPPSSPLSVKAAAYSLAADHAKTALPAKPSQPESSQPVEQVADYPEESLQALPHPAATFATKALASARYDLRR